MEMAMGLGEEEDGLRGSLTMPWGSSKRSSSAGNTARREIELRAPPCLEVEDDGFWPPPTPARRRGAPRRRRRPPAELRRGGCLLPPPFLLFLLLFASSPPFSSLSFLCKLKCVNERERERVLVAWRCFVRG